MILHAQNSQRQKKNLLSLKYEQSQEKELENTTTTKKSFFQLIKQYFNNFCKTVLIRADTEKYLNSHTKIVTP